MRRFAPAVRHRNGRPVCLSVNGKSGHSRFTLATAATVAMVCGYCHRFAALNTGSRPYGRLRRQRLDPCRCAATPARCHQYPTAKTGFAHRGALARHRRTHFVGICGSGSADRFYHHCSVECAVLYSRNSPVEECIFVFAATADQDADSFRRPSRRSDKSDNRRLVRIQDSNGCLAGHCLHVPVALGPQSARCAADKFFEDGLEFY